MMAMPVSVAAMAGRAGKGPFASAGVLQTKEIYHGFKQAR